MSQRGRATRVDRDKLIGILFPAPALTSWHYGCFKCTGARDAPCGSNRESGSVAVLNGPPEAGPGIPLLSSAAHPPSICRARKRATTDFASPISPWAAMSIAVSKGIVSTVSTSSSCRLCRVGVSPRAR